MPYQLSRTPSRLSFVFLIMSLMAPLMTAQQALSPEVYRKLGAAVFEVVVPKREDKDTFSYEEPLPRNLLPFSERNDPYSSIGTAFCIGKNRFLSAAHVFCLESETLGTSFFIRDPAGTVYPVDMVYKYANHQDCILFSVENPPDIVPLERQAEPALNTRVFTVGNAFGEGVIIRDGVLTSMTGENRDNAWKWLRFSAAASPGNSGGPLVDSEGKVLGITIARSENENFNLALPVTVADALPENVAKLNKQSSYGIPLFAYRTQMIESTEIALPLQIDELRAKLLAAHEGFTNNLLTNLLTEQKARIFPESKGSDFLLRNAQVSFLPGVAGEQSDYSWKLVYPQNTRKVLLADKSLFEWGEWNSYVIQHCSTTKADVEALQTWTDPQTAMDAVLTGYSLTRSMAGKNIRITSFGKPYSSETVNDRYGRIWQIARWNIAFADRVIIWLRLPTPDGYVAIFKILPTWDRRATVNDLGTIVNFVDVDYSGTLAQWSRFLANGAIIPSAFTSVAFSAVPGKSLSLVTPEFSLNLDGNKFAVTEDTNFSCYFNWCRTASGDVTMGLNCAYFRNSGGKTGGAGVGKVFHPGAFDGKEREEAWTKLAEKKFPFDGKPYYSDGNTNAYGTVDLSPFLPPPVTSQSCEVAWLVQMNLESQEPIKNATSAFRAFMSSISITAQGISESAGTGNTAAAP